METDCVNLFCGFGTRTMNYKVALCHDILALPRATVSFTAAFLHIKHNDRLYERTNACIRRMNVCIYGDRVSQPARLQLHLV